MRHIFKIFTKETPLTLDSKITQVDQNSDYQLVEDSDDMDEDVPPHQRLTDQKTESDVEPAIIETTTDLFGLTCEFHGLLFSSPNKYLYGEKTTASKYDVMSRFFREMNGLFDGFDWQHACIAGGLLTNLFEFKLD